MNENIGEVDLQDLYRTYERQNFKATVSASLGRPLAQ